MDAGQARWWRTDITDYFGESSAQDKLTEGSVEGFAESLVEALEAKDPNIERHLRVVSRLASLIGRRMSLPQEQMQALIVGGLLHDVGKIRVPDTSSTNRDA